MTTADTAPERTHANAVNRLTARWIEAASATGSTPAAVSGVSVWPLLVALLSGATGATRRELARACGVDADEAIAALRSVVESTASSKVTRIAMGLWANANAALDPEWTDKLAVGVGSLTGDAEADQRVLDAWVAANTNGAIESMPIDLDGGDVDLVLASTLHIGTAWASHFSDATRTIGAGPWQGRECLGLFGELPVDALRVVDGRLTVVTVAGAGDVDVVLALGQPEASGAEVLSAAVTELNEPAGVAGGRLPDGVTFPGGTVTTRIVPFPDQPPCVQLSTVAFTVSQESNLMEHVGVFGLESATDPRTSELTGVSAHEQVYVTQARQSAVATFSASGFHAAAATAVGVACGSAWMEDHEVKVVFASFDRPFGYLAVHRPTGMVLMAGWVDEPVIPPPGANLW